MQNYNNSYGGYNSPYSMYNNFQPNNAVQLNQYAFVNGIEGAKSFQLQPNQSILLMDSDSPVCYMKQANAVGQATLRYFKLIETTEDEVRGKNKQEKPNTEYALKSDIDALSKRLDDLAKKLDKSKKQAEKED